MRRISFFLSFFFLVNISQANYVPEELRLGILKHDVQSGLKHRYEKGYDANIEALWKSPDYSVFKYIFSPRPHIGASLNNKKGTHQFYAGLTWRLDFLTYLFVEGSLGGEVHTGKTGTRTRHKQKQGTRFLFRESLSLGVQFNEHHSLSVLIDHASNAKVTKANAGMGNFGLRYGYKF